LADRGYGSKVIVEAIEKVGSVAVIPPRSNRKIQKYYDHERYKELYKVECFFKI